MEEWLNISLPSEKILNQTYPSCEDENGSISTTHRVAHNLEQQLFRSSPSFRHYVDASTLKSRLLLASMTIIRKRMKKSQSQSRNEVLLQVLGQERLHVVQQIVQTIKDMKIQALMKGSLNGNIHAKSTQNESSSYPMIKSQGSIPQPARALFFNTTIVTSFESASVSLIPTLDWDSMIRDAQDNINAFKEWELESR